MIEGMDFHGLKPGDPVGPDDLETEGQEGEGAAPPKSTIKPPRPVGVAILMALHFLGGLAMVGVLAYGMRDGGQFANRIKGVGIPLLPVLVNLFLLPFLLLGSAVGMYKGTRWGWWFAAFYYFYSVVRNISAIWLIGQMADQIGLGEREMGRIYSKHIGRALISLLLLLYFFRDNVRQYFDMLYEKKFGLILTMLGVCGTLSAIGRFLGWLPVD